MRKKVQGRGNRKEKDGEAKKKEGEAHKPIEKRELKIKNSQPLLLKSAMLVYILGLLPA